MARMTDAGAWLAQAVPQARWELGRAARRFSRRFGRAGWLLAASVALAVVAALVLRQQSAHARTLQQLVAASAAIPAAPGAPLAGAPALHARLDAFAARLLPADEIPAAVQELLALGEQEGLAVKRGQYRMLPDLAGGFARYRMALPVKGGAPAIHRFMRKALRAQPNLALESVQIKRERIDSTQIEARIQWVLMTRMPAAGAVAP